MNLVLQTVNDSSTTLNELKATFGRLEKRISKIKESILASKLEVESIDPKVTSLDIETKGLRSHISLFVDENYFLKSQLSSVKHKMKKLERKKLIHSSM